MLKRNWSKNAKIQRYCYFSNSNHARSKFENTRSDNEYYHYTPIFPQCKTVCIRSPTIWLISKFYQFDRVRHIFPRVRWKFLGLFWVARAIFQLSGDCHHYRWQGCKFRPMLRNISECWHFRFNFFSKYIFTIQLTPDILKFRGPTFFISI
jgi:hypothetical protein